jgi:transposase
MATRIMTEPEASALYEQGKEAVVAWMLATDQRIRELEARLGQNSQNSSKPPSTDPPHGKLKPMSLRGRSGKKPGGQKGREGGTLKQIENPDHVRQHRPRACPRCQTDLETARILGHARRQVFDVPPPRMVVTEHRALRVACPCCGESVAASFPQGVEHPAQYGPHVLALATYLHCGHLIPFQRAAQIIASVTGAPFSPGTLHNAVRVAHARLEPFENQLTAALATAPILHADETGVRVAGKLHWAHERATKTLTLLFPHANRGGRAMDDLRDYSGTLVSDFWGSYVGLACGHQFCGAHLCRELQGAFERTGQDWARELKELLLACNDACHRARERGSPKLWSANALAREFDALVAEGLERTPPCPGGRKRGKVRCLLERLRDYRDQCLGFLFDLSLPFTNNEAERGLRMLKVKGKISGGFRTHEGASWFCRIRGYLQSGAKQGMNPLVCLHSVFAGAPILPSFRHT